MSARVTSITDIRTRARRGEMVELTSSRLAIFVVVVVALLLVVGLGAILSASSAGGILGESDRLETFRRQVRWVVVGLAAMVVTAVTPYTWYKRAAVWILGASTLGLILVPVLGSTRGGAERWIQVGSITVQPSEFSKLAVIVFLASVLADRRDRLDDLQQFIGPVLLSAGATCALVVLQPDLGTALIIAGAAGGVVLASGIPMRYILGGGVVIVALAGVSTVAYPYRRERFACFLDPLADPLGSCYQLAQSLMAVGSGHLMGVGLGASRARWAFLPNANTDFIFTIIAEETGFFGAIALLLTLTVLSLIGIWIAYRTGDTFARLLASGITAWISVQSIVNVGGVVGVIPVTGLALPFVSVGGSAMVAALAGAGILINITRTAPQNSEVRK
ncbi:MAG: putative lipid II flippase FtsW [bacterium]|nr:putative lipid II flippase FtsW [bacterium]